jgi:hypothetical protein
VLTTALIKCVVLTGSCTIKNSEFDYHMNDDLGRMVLNLMLTFVPVELWKMFYVYSNDRRLF